MMPHKGYLFPEVGVGTEDDRFHRSPAEPQVPLFSVYTAFPGAEVAILENSMGLLNATGKLAGLFQFLIGRLPFLILFCGGPMGGWGKEHGPP